MLECAGHAVGVGRACAGHLGSIAPGQHPRFEIGRNGVEVVGRGERSSHIPQPNRANSFVTYRLQDLPDRTEVSLLGL